MKPAVTFSLAALGAVLALAISLRSCLGPIALGPIHFVSPLGVESLFATVFLVLVALRSEPGSMTVEKASRFRIAPVLLALALIAAPFVPFLRDPFLSDDYILVSRATLDPSRILAVFHNPGGDGSFRPLGYLYFALLRHFGGTVSWKWHACALLLHLMNCALLYAIVWTLWPRSLAAFTAAVLFGLNGTRPEAVAWTAGNFDLLACAFTLSATLAILRGRVALAVPLLALAIMSKESAYAAPIVILGFAAAANRLRDPRIRNGLIAAVAVCGAMFLYRWTLFHGPGGYIDAATGQPQVFSFHWSTALKALFLRVWVNLLFPVNWDASAKSAILAAALPIFSGAVLYAAFSSRLSRRIAVCTAGLTVGALVPAYHLALIGENLNGSRILYLPAAGFCVLLAHLLRAKPLLTGACIVCSGAILLHNLDAWHRNAVLADRVCAGVSSQAPVHDLNGVVFFANGYRECVEMKAK